MRVNGKMIERMVKGNLSIYSLIQSLKLQFISVNSRKTKEAVKVDSLIQKRMKSMKVNGQMTRKMEKAK